MLSPRRLGLKQFRHDGCLSYLVFDQEPSESREALLIDPHADPHAIDDYHSYLAERSLKLKAVLDTHLHADHLSGTHLVQENFKCEIWMSEKTRSARVTRQLKDGDKIQIGRLEFQILETPGHTIDSITVYGEGLAFTGDTLMIGSTGRTDFDGGDASALWNSLHEKILKLPPDTLILPAHDYSDLIFSTVEIEKKKNSHALMASKADFVHMKKNEAIPQPEDEVRKNFAYNLAKSPEKPTLIGPSGVTACGAPMSGEFRPASISVAKYENKVKAGSTKKAANKTKDIFLDVREESEFAEGHIPHTTNLPLSELGLQLKALQKKGTVYLSCLSGRRSLSAAKTLSYVGLNLVVNVVGGFQAWQNAGFPVEKAVDKV